LTASLREVALTGKFYAGSFTQKLEEVWGEFSGLRYCIAMSCGTAALRCAVRYGISLPKFTNLVATSASGFSAAVEAAWSSRCKLHLTDGLFMPQELGSDFDGVGGLLAVVQHIGGYPGWIDPVKSSVAWKSQGVFTIEDCSHAHGTVYKKKRLGSFGDAAIWSFYPTKLLPSVTGGGMLATNDSDLAEFAIRYRNHGRWPGSMQMTVPGENAFMSEIGAASLLHHLSNWQRRCSRLEAIASHYASVWSGLIEMPTVGPTDKGRKDNYFAPYKMILRAKNRSVRDHLVREAETKGISVSTIYDPPLNRQASVVQMYPHISKYRFPETDNFSAMHFCPPFFPDMSDSEVEYVGSKIAEILKGR
jgi:perosamine synthetase